MSHLGRWLSAQVDGELDGVERDRVLNHLAGCDACRQEASALRALKRRMIALGESVSDAAIAGRLIERARSEPYRVGLSAGQTSWSAFPAMVGFWSRPPWVRPSWTGWRIASGSAGAAVLAIGALAFMLGGGHVQRPVPGVTPAVDVYWTKHIYDTGELPGAGAPRSQSSPATYAPGTVSPNFAKRLPRPSSP